MEIILIAMTLRYNGDFNLIHNALLQKEPIDHEILEKIDKLVANQTIQAITILDDDYPDNLKLINNPPFVIFYQGDRNLLKRNCQLIIGEQIISSANQKHLQSKTPLITINNSQKWEQQMLQASHPIINITNQPINLITQDQLANLVLSLVPPRLGDWSPQADYDNQDLHEQQQFALATGLSQNPIVRLNVLDVSKWSRIELLASEQNKKIVWIDELTKSQPKTKVKTLI